MIIKNRKQGNGVSPVALIAVGGGIAGLLFWLSQKPKSSESGNVDVLTTTTTTTYQLPPGASRVVPFGDILLYDYPTDTTVNVKADVENENFKNNNDLTLLQYELTIPAMGLASDAYSNEAVALKGFEIATNKILSKRNNIDLIKQCIGEDGFKELNFSTFKIKLANTIDAITDLCDKYMSSDSNPLPKRSLSVVDKQRLAAAFLWAVVQNASAIESVSRSPFDVIMNQSQVLDKVAKAKTPSTTSVGYVEAFLRGLFNCEVAGYEKMIVIPASGTTNLPLSATPSKYLAEGLAPAHDLEPAFFNGAVFYDI